MIKRVLVFLKFILLFRSKYVKETRKRVCTTVYVFFTMSFLLSSCGCGCVTKYELCEGIYRLEFVVCAPCLLTGGFEFVGIFYSYVLTRDFWISHAFIGAKIIMRRDFLSFFWVKQIYMGSIVWMCQRLKVWISAGHNRSWIYFKVGDSVELEFDVGDILIQSKFRDFELT